MSRRVLVLVHTGRADSLRAGIELIAALRAAGIEPAIVEDPSQMPIVEAAEREGTPLRRVSPDDFFDDFELIIAVGGDGTILRAAELSRGNALPIVGVNLGHVGFLAEAERAELGSVVAKVLAHQYTVEERVTLEVEVYDPDGTLSTQDWALNEAALEKEYRGRMMEVAITVDARPLETFGCDGIVVSTPTGSTAHAFSAGGPVVWPDVDAILVVSLSAHALFSRPLVVGPNSTVTVDVLPESPSRGGLWCDGRRMTEVPQGGRIIIQRAKEPVRLARLATAPFTDRLVNKFSLPVDGWRVNRGE